MRMNMLVDKMREKYLDGEIEWLLQGTGIEVLKDYMSNWSSVLDFNRRYYATGEPKVVLCGINPGRLCAGKTGVPFLDFKSLSKLMPSITREDSERSAQFFYDVVAHFGAETFYKSFYVTNVSWLGYSKNGRNLNFDQLPPLVLAAVLSRFRDEMNFIKPTVVISLGRVVHMAVKQVLDVSVNTDITLPHPNYCAFGSRKAACKSRYIDKLESFINMI